MMDLGNSLQAAEVAVGALSLLVASLGVYLTWHAANGRSTLPHNPLRHGAANDTTLAQLRHWEEHMQVLPRYHHQTLHPINDWRAVSAVFMGCLVAFVKRLTGVLVS